MAMLQAQFYNCVPNPTPRRSVIWPRAVQQCVAARGWCGDLNVLPHPLSPVRWRAGQFRNPKETYQFRARIEAPLTGNAVSQS